MRVTHVITRLIVGGAQENTIASVLGLQKKNSFAVDLISGPSTGPEGELVSSFELQTSPSPPVAKPHGLQQEPRKPGLILVPDLVRPIHPARDFLALRQLEKIFRETRPNIVHTHSGKAGILGRLAAARAGVPIILHTIHGPSFGNFQSAFPNFIFRIAEHRAASVTTHFVAVAQAMIEQYLAAGIGSRAQYTKIFSGFDLAPFLSTSNDLELRRKLGIQPDDIVIGKIARLFKLKGHGDLIAVAPELIRRFPQIKFLLVGDGKWRSRFENEVRARGLEKNFVFTGLVTPSEIPQLAGTMDILVHLSLREGLARALPQALAAGKPVVAYDCDGAGEVCRENETGFLVKPRDLTSLTGRLVQLAENPALRNRLGAAGRDFVQDKFGVERMVDELQSLYFRLLKTSA